MYRQNHPDAPGMHNMANMADSHTRVNYSSNATFFERIGSSLAGILIGVGILVSASGLLFWNEGRAVQTAKSLDEGLRIVFPLRTTEVALEENSGKLVHLTGSLKTGQELVDPLYGVSVHAVKLKRKVEMFQWVEQESRRNVNEGSQTREEVTYSYSMEWTAELVKSTSFDNPVGHHNPNAFAVESTEHTAEDARVGVFYLSEGLLEKINVYKDLIANNKAPQPGVQLYMGSYYHGKDPLRPQVGDLKVTFSYAGSSGDEDSKRSADLVSIIAMQYKHRLKSFKTDAGDDLEVLYYGKLSPEVIFGNEHAQNAMLTWAIRFGGWLLMFIGFGCITRIMIVLVDWLPIVGDLVAMGVHLMNLVIAISLSLTVIAIGWIRYRPLLGMTILAMAAAPFVLTRLRARQSSRDRNV